MTEGKKRGGPNTARGKARSSQNAQKHGLTSHQPSSAQEKAKIDHFVKELTDYYKPQSPLETLQIQRIAICRAKLAYLYELEQIKLELASQELKTQPEKILEKIPGVQGIVKGMVLESIEYGEISLPCKLNLPLLETICSEIEKFNTHIQNRYEFARSLPELTKYLNAFAVVGLNNTDQWMEKLAEVSHNLEIFSEAENGLSGRWDEVTHYYLLGLRYEKQLEKEAMQPKLEELERYQEGVRARHGLKPKPKPQEAETEKTDRIDTLVVLGQLRRFKTLYQSYQAAKRIVSQYQEVEALMMRSISLPAAESDLLLRYQTTLERRLSQAIGELLELQKRATA